MSSVPLLNVTIQDYSYSNVSVRRLRHVQTEFRRIMSKDQINYQLVFKSKKEDKIAIKLLNNVADIKAKYLNKGLSLLVFQQPSCQVMISILELTSANFSWHSQFLEMVKCYNVGRKPKQKSIICKSSFSPSLQKLRQIFPSKHITEVTSVLDLTGSRIKDLPKPLGNLPLTHLNLNANELGRGRNKWPWVNGEIQKTLTHIHLDNNKLKRIPPELSRCFKLVFVSCNNNELRTIPAGLLDPKRFLLYFNAAGNRDLSFLPYPLRLRSLNIVDCLCLIEEAPSTPKLDTSFSLRKIAGTAVLSFNLRPKFEAAPEEILEYLDRFMYCSMCFKPTMFWDTRVGNYLRFIKVHPLNLANEVVSDSLPVTALKIICPKCQHLY